MKKDYFLSFDYWTRDESKVVISDPGSGEIRIVDPVSLSFSTIEVPTEGLTETAEVAGSAAPEGIAITPGGRWAYITLQGLDKVAEVDLDRGVITRTVATGVWPDGVGYSPLVGR